jgi:3-hydroxybutyryl-CoA dehydrogenase
MSGGAVVSPPARFRIRAIAVIGAGVAGRGFALACAAAGFDVVVEDVMPAKLRRAQEEYADLGLLSSRAQSPGRLEIALTVEDAVREADVVVDFVPDELESKLEIFCLVDRMAPPKTVLLTPSDALSITDLASCTYRGKRCFAVRGGFVAGGPVRVVYPEGADAGALEAVRGLLLALGGEVRVEEDSLPFAARTIPS